MLLSRLHFVLLVFMLFFFFSCKKEDVQGSVGPQGPDGQNGNPTITGKIFGKIHLYDSLGKEIADNSGATVKFVNGDPEVSLTTTADGSFISPEMPAGLYEMELSKPGFGTMKIYNFLHPGGLNTTQAGILNLGQKRTAWLDIKKFTVDTLSEGYGRYMLFTLILAHPQKLPYPYVVIYFNTTPGSGNGDNDYVYRDYFYQQNDSTIISYQYGVDLTTKTDAFNTTNDVYISAAIDNTREFSYADPGGKVFPCTGTLSNEVKSYNNLKYK